MTTEHTPRPWKVGGRYGCNRTEINNDSGSRALATVWTHDRVAMDKHCSTDKDFTESAEGMANARLIAAAPELLAVCTYAEAVIDKWASQRSDGGQFLARYAGDAANELQQVFVALRDVVRKAIGEPS